MEHSISRFLIPFPFNRFPFLFPKLELPVEVFKEFRIQMTLNLGIKAISSGLYWGAYRKQAI